MRRVAAITVTIFGALCGAAAAAHVVTLQPGSVKRVGSLLVYCTTSRKQVTPSRVFLTTGHQVTANGVTVRCVKRLAVTPIPTTTPTPTPSPTVPAVKVGTARSNPVPLGTAAPIGNGWTVQITGVNTDAWPAIQAANLFNAAPPTGSVDVIVTVSATYTGAGSSHLDSGYTLRAVGASNVSYTSFTNNCGVLPVPHLDLDDPEVFTGGTVSGNAACFQVTASDAGTLVLYTAPLAFPTPAPVWFALR